MNKPAEPQEESIFQEAQKKLIGTIGPHRSETSACVEIITGLAELISFFILIFSTDNYNSTGCTDENHTRTPLLVTALIATAGSAHFLITEKEKHRKRLHIGLLLKSMLITWSMTSETNGPLCNSPASMLNASITILAGLSIYGGYNKIKAGIELLKQLATKTAFKNLPSYQCLTTVKIEGGDASKIKKEDHPSKQRLSPEQKTPAKQNQAEAQAEAQAKANSRGMFRPISSDKLNLYGDDQEAPPCQDNQQLSQ